MARGGRGGEQGGGGSEEQATTLDTFDSFCFEGLVPLAADAVYCYSIIYWGLAASPEMLLDSKPDHIGLGLSLGIGIDY